MPESPRCSAFWRSAPIERFVSLDILVTGVLAFECALSSLTSALVHSRRTALPFFFGFVTFNLLAPYLMRPRTNTSRGRDNQTKAENRTVPPSAKDFLRAIPIRGPSFAELSTRFWRTFETSDRVRSLFAI